MLDPNVQFKNFLNNAKNVLLLIPENPSSDAVGSAWALYYFLEKRGINPTIAFSNNLSPKFDFLPRPEKILTEINGARDFVLSFDTSRNKISSLCYEEKDDKFNIYLTPERGTIDPRDFSFILAKFKYDLLIVIGCSDLEKLGKIYGDNTDLFFEVPIANIDCKSNNDNFGQINIIDVTSSSCAEIVGKLLEEIDGEAIDKPIATCLLTGIIGATDSFQKRNTTPRAFLASAQLMDKGADQQEIVRWLYKTHPLHVLKLWGKAMAKLNWNSELKMIWSEITVDDFVQSRASTRDLEAILNKLQGNYCEGKIFMILYNDTPSSTVVLIKTIDAETLQNIHINFGGEIKAGTLEVKIEKGDMGEVGKEIIEKIKNL